LHNIIPHTHTLSFFTIRQLIKITSGRKELSVYKLYGLKFNMEKAGREMYPAERQTEIR
jgi:hypothetical protein